MKIIAKDSAYVQKTDILYLLKSNLKIPESIYLKISCEVIDENNKYEFIKFTNHNDIKYFKNFSWIIDYNDIKHLNENDIINMCQEIASQINNIADKYNKMSDIEKDKNEDMVQKCELLDYKMHSLRDALWFKQGHINLTLPEIQNYNKINNILKKMFKKNC